MPNSHVQHQETALQAQEDQPKIKKETQLYQMKLKTEKNTTQFIEHSPR